MAILLLLLHWGLLAVLLLWLWLLAILLLRWGLLAVLGCLAILLRGWGLTILLLWRGLTILRLLLLHAALLPVAATVTLLLHAGLKTVAAAVTLLLHAALKPVTTTVTLHRLSTNLTAPTCSLIARKNHRTRRRGLCHR